MDLDYNFGGLGGNGSYQLLNDATYSQMTLDTRWRMIYPAPYFDPIAMQTILDPKIIMQWGRYFYDWHPIIHAAINKMVQYPITDFLFNTDDNSLKQNYKDAFAKLHVRESLIRMGLDYFICGNAYLSCIMPFKRMLICPKCHTGVAATQAKFKYNNGNVIMECPHCHNSVKADIQDSQTKDLSDMKLIHWNPLFMQVDYDEVLGNYSYYYSLPEHVKTSIAKGETKYIAQYPMYFIDAARNKKLIHLFTDKLKHLKRDTHSATYHQGLGQPIISPVLKYLFHLLILLRAQDALAIDQILPWTVFSPSPNGGIDPAGDMDLSNWKRQVKEEYNKWKKNPLRKSFMPVPMNAQIIGAQGKSLMLTNEINEVTNQILAGMGVPNEFVFGGLQWSGASISLRMLENQFINYRTMMQEVINYIVDNISIYFGYPKVKVTMQSFKMADDVAQKDLLLRMADGGMVSKHTVLAQTLPEVDYDAEQEFIHKEQADEQKRQMQQQINQQNAAMAMGIDPNGATPQEIQSQQGDNGEQHGDLPQQNPPRAEGGNAQI